MTGFHATQQVFELVLVRPVRLPEGEHPSLVQIAWRAPLQGDRLVQVYVDERLAAVSCDPQVRSVWLHLDRGQSGARRIELLAVTPGSDGAWRPQLEHTAGWPASTRAGTSLAVERDEGMPINAQVRFELNGQPRARQPLWPNQAHRGGFGAVFGQGGFGQDAATGPGLGVGELGVGPLGADGGTSRFSVRLKPGQHTLTAQIDTEAGRESLQPQTHEVLSAPEPATGLSIDPDYVLRWQTAGDLEDA